MNQNYREPNYVPNQSTYPPYMNNANYTGINSNNGASNNSFQSPNSTTPTTIPALQYAENLFSLNVGKRVSVYFSYPDSVEWRDRVFTGTILESGRDYLLLRDDNDEIVLLWLVYINYAIFTDKEISY